MKYKYWLTGVNGISSGKIRILLNYFKDPSEIYFASEKALSEVNGLQAEDINSILQSKRNWNVDKRYEQFLESGVDFVTIESERYPQKLMNIVNPPYCLYVKGNLPKEDCCSVGIVGARGRSSYGASVARKLGERLASNGVNIISGMARGIDADAHSGAIIGEGKTFAVVACGVDVIYPKENRFLYEEIISSGGGIISEYPLQTQPIRTLFPSRNRIISGLSDAVCVVEARKRSGSLITADFAMEQGRDVYAVPGRITDELAEGCNSLIFQGAIPVVSIDDCVRDILKYDTNECNQLSFQNFLLEKDESLVYSLLDFHPVGLGKIIDNTNFDIAYILEVLEHLKLKGFVKEIVPGAYVRNI